MWNNSSRWLACYADASNKACMGMLIKFITSQLLRCSSVITDNRRNLLSNSRGLYVQAWATPVACRAGVGLPAHTQMGTSLCSIKFKHTSFPGSSLAAFCTEDYERQGPHHNLILNDEHACVCSNARQCAKKELQQQDW